MMADLCLLCCFNESFRFCVLTNFAQQEGESFEVTLTKVLIIELKQGLYGFVQRAGYSHNCSADCGS
jgi:hypothetical protein